MDRAGACVALACFVEGLTSKVHLYSRLQLGYVDCLLILVDYVWFLIICSEVKLYDMWHGEGKDFSK